MLRTALALSALALLPAAGAGAVPSPDQFLGHRVGEDRYLAPYARVVDYFHALDAASERVTVEVAGRSTRGNEILVVALTSEANGRELDRYREISRRLANPDRLAAGEAESLIAEGKTIALVTGTIHSTEVGATQMVMELAYELATTDDPAVRGWLDDVVLLVVPSINPDGQDLVIDWYDRWLGSEYEGGPMPWLYHPYVGHDLNRDFYMLTQAESRVINDVVYHRWFPQVFLDEHQMGQTGPRMVVPPQTDPLAPEVSSLIFRQADLLGTAMALRLEEAGKGGVGSNMIFDSYWPGATRNTAWWKNVTGLLTEVASADVASPIYVDPGELRGGFKGLPDPVRRSNYPTPWAGGWWHLSDVIDYETIATRSLLESCSRYRRTLLENFWRMNAEAVERGRSEPPYAFLVPAEQHDPVAAARLVALLLAHGVRVERATGALTLERTTYGAGTYVIPAAQPYRPFLLTMLRRQQYPEVRPYAGGPVIPPYDVTAWSLPLLMGVEVAEAAAPVTAELVAVAEPAWPGGEVAAGAGGWRLSHAADSAPTALNQLLAEGKRAYWLAPGSVGGEVGDLYVPAGEASAAEMSRLSERFHLPVTPLEAAPRGPALRLKPVHVGLYKPWVASMDEGWTRWLLEQYGFAYESLTNDRMRSGDYRGKVDALVLPDVERDVIEKGEPAGAEERRFWRPLPPAYSGGVEAPGGEALKHWVRDDGGTLVALSASTAYAIELFGLPVVDVLARVGRDSFNAPGSLLRILLDPDQPLAWGLRREEAAYFANSPAFETRPPDPRFRRTIVARYPDDAGDVLVSGYLQGGERLARRAAVVDFEVGAGRVVLFGFRPQHRAQPLATFKLLFNALYLAKATPEELP
jgi:Zinc carboxypeptidase